MYAHRIFVKKLHRAVRPERFDHDKEVERWHKDGGDEHSRYSYPLNKDSVVFDVGGYEGEWSQKIDQKYHCNIFVFEPVNKYFKHCQNLFAGHKKIQVFRCGLAGRSRQTKINVDEFHSSIFGKSPKQETTTLTDIKEFCRQHKVKKIDLVKINIEGGEYELMNRIIDTGLAQNVEYFQVQFHELVPDAQKKMERIQRKLSKTHKPTYQYWTVWESWKRKRL